MKVVFFAVKIILHLSFLSYETTVNTGQQKSPSFLSVGL